MKLGIVIPLFNRFNAIQGLLECLEKQTFQNYIILVVDHGTKDFLPADNNSTKLAVIKRPSNLWFTGAVNEGIRHLLLHHYDLTHVMILNDDSIIHDDRWIEKLLMHARSGVLVSCMAVTPENNIIYAGLKFKPYKFIFEILKDTNKIVGASNDFVECDILPTRGLVICKNDLKTIGLLNEEKLPHYGSDFEWTARAKRLGCKLIMLNSTSIITDINDSRRGVFGRNRYDPPRLKNFLNDFINIYKAGNFYLIRNYSMLMFRFPYSLIYMLYHISRKIGGFIYNNYIHKQ